MEVLIEPEPQDVEVRSSTHGPDTWVNDWDLLSPRFQSEAGGYLQVVALLVAVVLLHKRSRLFQQPLQRGVQRGAQGGVRPSAPVGEAL